MTMHQYLYHLSVIIDSYLVIMLGCLLVDMDEYEIEMSVVLRSYGIWGLRVFICIFLIFAFLYMGI